MENLIFLIQTPLALGIKKMDFGITLTIVISKKTNENSVCVS